MKLTFHQRRVRALAILGKQTAADVEAELRSLEREPQRRYRFDGSVDPQTKQHKRAAQQLRDRIERVKKSLAECERYELLVVPPSEEWWAELDRLQRVANSVTKKALRKPDRSDPSKRRAANAAARLMKTTTGEVGPITRGRGFCQLASVLYGDTSADLFNYCLSIKQREDRNRDEK